MTHLQQYVPCNSTEDEIINPMTNEPEKVYIDQFHYILFGGDQLTVEELRKRGTTKVESVRAHPCS